MGDPASAADGEGPSLPAGDFSAWLAQMRSALRGEAESVVPCGGCTACCTSSQFIHIGPDETETLEHIPAALLTPAPRMPAGHVVLGYDSRGCCPMLVDNCCSIYEHRPRTCRTYDCRVFAATGVEAGPGQELIAVRAAQWRFDFPTGADRTGYHAVRAAATFVEQHPDVLGNSSTLTPTRLAATAVGISAAFVADDGVTGARPIVEPDREHVRKEIRAAGLAPGDAN